MSDNNKGVVLHLVEAFNQHNLAEIAEMYRDCVYHSPLIGELNGEGYRQFISEVLDAFPDGQWTIDDQIAEGDEVVTRWRFNGTHNVVFRGERPTGKKVVITGIAIDRIVDGKIVEEWEESDSLSFRSGLSVTHA